MYSMHFYLKQTEATPARNSRRPHVTQTHAVRLFNPKLFPFKI